MRLRGEHSGSAGRARPRPRGPGAPHPRRSSKSLPPVSVSPCKGAPPKLSSQTDLRQTSPGLANSGAASHSPHNDPRLHRPRTHGPGSLATPQWTKQSNDLRSELTQQVQSK